VVKEKTVKKSAGASKTIKPADFVHLHNHTQYSLLDGLTKIPELIEQTKKFGMDAMAITDHGTLSGAIEFYSAARSSNIKPIIGIEAYMATRKLENKEPGTDKQYFHLIILAMNNQGYQNLMRLSTIANLEGFYYKPRIDRETLEKYNEGLIVLSGCINGELGDAIRQEQPAKAEETAKWYKNVFGDRYYIEIQDHGHPNHSSSWDEQTKVNSQAKKIAEKLDIPMVITGDAHYLRKEDQDAHEILLCVQTGSFLSEEDRMSLKDFELYVADPKEVIERWGDELPEAIKNTKRIAERCDVEIELGKYLIPKFKVPKGENEKSCLDKLTYQGLVKRYEPGKQPKEKITELKKQLNSEIIERAEYELGVIDRMGFNGYFLIVQDFINWGKDRGIVFGPGRGSGAGSIVAYALRITELDPLSYDLLFERFLNPDRISMPDFDIDIQDTRRDEVIEYCVNKYGKDKVANIVTFGRMAARNAVRDVARVLQVPYSEADRLAKMIPPPVQGRHIPLERSLKDDKDLKAEYESNSQAKEVFDLAIKLEGTIRSHGVHAAGVVIAPDDIVKFTPLEMAQKGVVSTQYSMGPIEDIGLLKMDFLGLSNLTIIKNTLRIVKKVHGTEIDINKIPLDDKKTFKLFQSGDTTGVFQLESSGMKRYLKELKPTRFDDIVAMVALYRPGPMQWIDEFIARKHGNKKIEYIHPGMEPALKSTYGVIVYQEQVMQISKELSGFSGGQADYLRKAIGKKIPEALAKLKTDFIEGAIKKSGADRRSMEKFWKQLEEFAAYCFNKAHAACYAMIAYWTAYLKANYPTAFMAALMTSDYDDTDRLAIEMNECRQMGIEVLLPDVNESFVEFAVVPGKNQIRYGMNAIKNVGTGAVEEIIRAREKDGEFSSLEDFLKKVNVGIVNKKALESLAKTGAMDKFGDRNVLVSNLETMVKYANKIQKERASGQTDLFGGSNGNSDMIPRLTLAGAEEFSRQEQLSWERDLMGLYLSRHPLSDYEGEIKHCTNISDIGEADEDQAKTIGGIIMTIREITTKKGQKMAFVRIEDMGGDIEAVVFPGVYDSTKEVWQKDNLIVAKGKVTSKDKGGVNGETKIMIDDAKPIGENRELKTREKRSNGFTVKNTAPQVALPQSPPAIKEKRVYVRMLSSDDEQSLKTLKTIMDSQPGNASVVLVVGKDNSKQAIKLPARIEPSTEAIAKLEELFGKESIKFQ
jgi:DNA polymerase-3 subunit alpha